LEDKSKQLRNKFIRKLQVVLFIVFTLGKIIQIISTVNDMVLDVLFKDEKRKIIWNKMIQTRIKTWEIRSLSKKIKTS